MSSFFELRNETGRCSVGLVVVGDELFVKSALAGFGPNDCAERYASLIDRCLGDQFSLVLHDKQRELTWVKAEWTEAGWKPLPAPAGSRPYILKLECPNCGNTGEAGFEDVGNVERCLQCQACQFQGDPNAFDLAGMTLMEKYHNWIKLGNSPDPHSFGDRMTPIPGYVWNEASRLASISPKFSGG